MKQLKSIERNTELQITVLDALRMLYQAWDRVTEKTIKNCFRHANFVSAATNEMQIPLTAMKKIQKMTSP